MNDNESGVYVIMTSNDVSQLPPELTRSGRLDAIWYFGLPTREERRSIFKIHFDKKKKEVTDILLNEAVKDSEMFTGAEIQQAVKNALRHAYSRYLKDGNANITTDDVAEGCHEVIPVAKSSREKIAALDNYCRSRARLASYESEEDKKAKQSVNDEDDDGFDFD